MSGSPMGREVVRRKLRRSRKPRKKRLPYRSYFFGVILVLSLGLVAHQLRLALLQPKAVFVLGGHEEREKFAAQLAQQHPELDIWVSSGSPPDYAQRIFAKYGIKGDRLHLDYQAKDTVTNFTSLVDELKRQNIDSVYLVTSKNHMQRARVVANVIFGSQGIAVKPLAVPSHNPPEDKLKCLRDGVRAVLWVITGETGDKWFNENPATTTTNENL